MKKIAKRLLIEALPMNLISKRLIFRDLTLSDAKELFEMYSDKEAMKYRGSKPLNSIADAQTFIKTAFEKAATNAEYRLAIIETATVKLIGTFLIKKLSDDICEIGYSFGKKYWGKGYASESIAVVMKYLTQKGFDKLIATTRKENIASYKVLEKCGFELKGNYKDDVNLFMYELDLTK